MKPTTITVSILLAALGAHAACGTLHLVPVTEGDSMRTCMGPFTSEDGVTIVTPSSVSYEVHYAGSATPLLAPVTATNSDSAANCPSGTWGAIVPSSIPISAEKSKLMIWPFHGSESPGFMDFMSGLPEESYLTARLPYLSGFLESSTVSA